MERVARLQLRRSMAWRWRPGPPMRDVPQKGSTAFHSASGRFAVGGANLAGRSGVRKNSILPIISERFRRWFDGLTPHSGPLPNGGEGGSVRAGMQKAFFLTIPDNSGHRCRCIRLPGCGALWRLPLGLGRERLKGEFSFLRAEPDKSGH